MGESNNRSQIYFGGGKSEHTLFDLSKSNTVAGNARLR